MNMVSKVVFGIIVNGEHQFSVWPTHRRLPPGWLFSGPTGTRKQMQELVRQQFVETIPATYVTADKRFRASRWAD